MFRCTRFVIAAMAAVVCLFGNTAHATVPSLMSYSGVLTDGSGTPQVGTFSVTFSIYDAPSGGAQLWTEVQSVTTDSDGRFNVLLGSSTALTDGVFSAPDRYLGTAVSTDPEMTPRARIATVGFAFSVSTIDGTTGGTITGEVAVLDGNITLAPSSTTSGNIVKGGLPFLHNAGTNNTCLGIDAGNLTLSGMYNTAVGTEALEGNASGSYNTAVGVQSMQNNTTGENNTSIGIQAMRYGTTGNYNTAIGSGTMLTGGGGSNTAVGAQSLYFNSSGISNAACGTQALYKNTSGSSNTACGAGALHENTSATSNSALGWSALYFTTDGHSNTACGEGASYMNVGGDYNVAVGRSALYQGVSGNNNTAIGTSALLTNVSGSNNTAIGYNADVSSGAWINATAIGNGAIVNSSNKIRLGNSSVSVIEGQVAYTFTSDKNSKENFREVDGDEVLAKLRDMEVQSWNYKGHDPEQFRHYGPVAQDFYAAFGKDDVGTVGTPTTINSGDMAGILMIAVQALEKRTAENDELKARVETLERLVRAQLAAAKDQ